MLHLTSDSCAQGSKLNPDAPTFTPRSLADIRPAIQTSPVRPDRTGDAHFDRNISRPALHQQQAMPVPHVQYFAAPLMMIPAPYSFYQTHIPHPPVSKDSTHMTSLSTSTEGPTRETKKTTIAAAPQEGSSSSAEISTPRVSGSAETLLKTPRYSRRIQSKSEPFSGTGSSPSA